MTDAASTKARLTDRLFTYDNVKTYLWVFFFICIALFPIIVGETRYLPILINAGLYAIPTLGLVILFGHGGQLSLGQATFSGTAAYVSSYISIHLAVPVILSILIGIGVALLLGLLVSPILRLKRFYFAVSTIALNLCFYNLVKGLPFTGGANGMAGVPPLDLGFFRFDTAIKDYYLIWGFVAVALWTTTNLLNSQFGRSLRMLSKDDISAKVLGIDTTAAKRNAFLFAIGLAALSGALASHYMRICSPDEYQFSTSVGYSIMNVLGGAVSPLGAVLGSALIAYIQEALQVFSQFRDIIYGLCLIVVMIYIPIGMAGGLEYLFIRMGRFNPNAQLDVIRKKVAGIKELAPKPSCSDRTVLEVKNVYKSFGGVAATVDVSFNVKCGQIKGILGPNGAGKTTLFNLVSGLMKVDKGSILFNNQEICGCLSHEISCRGLGRTFQVIRPLGGTSVLENVLVGWEPWYKLNFFDYMFHTPKMKRKEAEATKSAMENIDLMGLGAAAYQMVDKLPIGQRKVEQIAQVLTSKSELLLLDEPAGGLNDSEIAELSKVLKALAKQNYAILLVEHNVDLVMDVCDEIVFLDFGEKLAEGTPTEIKNNPKVQSAYLGE
jgi:branched-chain amino acid transport system permease protein